MAGNSNQKVVPQCQSVLNQWKYEIASELGLPVGTKFDANTEFATELGEVAAGSVGSDYWGHITARDTGAVGGQITRRLVAEAQKSLLNS